MDLGSILVLLAVALLVGIFVSRPFLKSNRSSARAFSSVVDEKEQRKSTLLAEYDRYLNALQELEFDFTLGKIPAEDYPQQRTSLLQSAAETLQNLDAYQAKKIDTSVEDRIEAAVLARRNTSLNKSSSDEDLEALIASRRQTHQEKTGGFCPKCGKPILKSDRFCPKCGTALESQTV